MFQWLPTSNRGSNLDFQDPQHYQDRSDRCREMAGLCYDRMAAKHLRRIADLYDQLVANPDLNVPPSFNNA